MTFSTSVTAFLTLQSSFMGWKLCIDAYRPSFSESIQEFEKRENFIYFKKI